MRDPKTTMVFNVHGVHVGAGVQRYIGGAYGDTDWKLGQFSSHPEWAERAESWIHGVRTENPFT